MANLERTDPPVYRDTIRKLEPTDPAHADLFNPIHAQLLENGDYLKKELEEGDSGSRVVVFEEAAKRENLVSGDTHRTLFGKIRRFLSELKTVAFTGRYLDLSGRPGDASETAAGFLSAADKKKLNGIAEGANRYTHPANHPASMITQDATHRFATDAEKSSWSGKAGTAAATTSANGLMSAADKTKLNGIAAGANKYTHPANHPASMITQDATHRFATDAEKSSWNGKAAGSHNHDDRYFTESEINTKLNGKANSSHTHTKSQITDFPNSLPANGGTSAACSGNAATATNATNHINASGWHVAIQSGAPATTRLWAW